jgi:glycosyltransferase involved in cell wall biosynthesis
VITPVGPGHEKLFADCAASVSRAVAHSKGPFSAIGHLPVDDTAARLGRSAGRNQGVRAAAAAGSDWIFFLDADDLLLPPAFTRAGEAIGRSEAVWGAICELVPGTDAPRLRALQERPIVNVLDLLQSDPFFALQIGHFVRTPIAIATPFADDMNAGEDYDYYLRVWARYRCEKIREPFFVNRRGFHSTGPRSATGREWIYAVRRSRLRFIQDHCREFRALGAGRNATSGVRLHDGWRIRRWQLNPLGIRISRLLAWGFRRSAACRSGAASKNRPGSN